MSALDFSLAETHFRVNPSSGLPPLRAPNNYSLFLGASAQSLPGTTYTAYPDTMAPGSGKILWDNGIWRTRESGDYHDIEIHDVPAGKWLKSAHIASDFSCGNLLLPFPDHNATFVRPLYHPQDRAVILGRFCHLGSIMVHSSAVKVDGKVLLFSGASGAGKTTIARLWRNHGELLLNDERNLLRPAADTIRAGASPWHGEENKVNAATGPLAAIFFLNQAPHNSLRPMTVEESLARLMTVTFIPVFIPSGPAQTLNACHAILERVPAYELNFTPDVRALDLCRSIL